MTTADESFLYFTATQSVATKLSATYVKSRKQYRIPMNIYALREFYKLCGEQDKEYIVDLGKALKVQQETLLHTKLSEPCTFDKRLRPYQNQDVAFLSQLPHKAIFNEQRTGKTPTTIITLREQQARRILIVCPSGLKLNWGKEFHIWLDRPSIIIAGTKPQRKKLLSSFNTYDDVIGIISYETLRNDHAELGSQFDAMVVDEAHRLRNFKSLQSKAILKVGQQATSRYALTGTPSVNHAADLYGILKFLYPKQYPSYWQFAERYFTLEENYFSGGKDVGKLRNNREREWVNQLNLISTQRKRVDIMPWIIDTPPQVIELESESIQRKEYEQMLTTYRVGDVDASTDLVKLIRLRQIALAPELLGLQGSSPKIDFIKDYIDDNPNTGIVIFSAFTSFLNLLSSKLKIPHGLLKGGVKNPQQIVEDFQSGKFNILLSNIIVGGVGHTMDRGNVIIFTDRSFSPMENDQAQDRIVPTTEAKAKDAKLIIDLVMKDSVDQKVLTLLSEKKDITAWVNSYGLKLLLFKGDVRNGS